MPFVYHPDVFSCFQSLNTRAMNTPSKGTSTMPFKIFKNKICNSSSTVYWHLISNKQGNYKTNIPLMQVQHIWKRFMCNATIHFLHGLYFSNRRVIFYFSWSFTCVGTCKFRLSLILLVYQIAIILSVVLLQFVTINTYHKVKTRIWSVYWVSFN